MFEFLPIFLYVSPLALRLFFRNKIFPSFLCKKIVFDTTNYYDLGLIKIYGTIRSCVFYYADVGPLSYFRRFGINTLNKVFPQLYYTHATCKSTSFKSSPIGDN